MVCRCKRQPHEDTVGKLPGPHIDGPAYGRLELNDGRIVRVKVLHLWICTVGIQFATNGYGTAKVDEYVIVPIYVFVC